MSTVELQVNGKTFGGWISARVERSIEQAAGQFQLELTERFPGQKDRWAVECGAECTLLLDGTKVITGAIDRSERSGSSSDLRLTVSGRDRTADMIDSAAGRADGTPGEIRNVRIDKLAEILLKGFGIGVTVATGLNLGAAFSSWSVEPGESIHESLERAARQRGVLLTSDGRGNLVITRAGSAAHPTALVEGENVLSWSVTRDDSQRFHRYIALGQSSDIGAGSYSASAIDSAIRKTRRCVIVAEDLANGVSLRQRIQWERNVRRARGRQVSITVAEFGSGGRLWNPNERAQVRIPSADFTAELLIVGVAQSLDQNGSTSQLTLAPPDAYDLLPQPDPKSDAGGLAL